MSSLLESPVVHESTLYRQLDDSTVECSLCERRCRIPLGAKGFCRTRINIDGKLYTVVYGNLSAIESRPIEMKPFFHYWPGSTAFTFSTWSCNFDCVWCQNWSLSKTSPDRIKPRYYSPEEIVDLAVRKGDEGLCSSFQEPTLLTDWNLDLFKAGKAKGLYSCYVSNGYMTLEALKQLWAAGMDGLKIDLKGDAETYERFCGGADVEKVWRNVREAKRMGFHIEMVNLVVNKVNDDEQCLRWVVERHLEEAGTETPLHFTRYYPSYKFERPATPAKRLEEAYELARRLGVFYPYIGNVAGHRYENTYCPDCRETLIKRYGSTIVRYQINEHRRCPKCGFPISIRGRLIQKSRLLL